MAPMIWPPQHRNREDGPPAVLEQELQMNIPLDQRDVW
jgi:hypothetical protein